LILFRGLNEEFGYTTAILGDLQGPKLRVGVMKEDVVVNEVILLPFKLQKMFRNSQTSLYELQRVSKRCKSWRKNSFRRWKINV
jgi:pyruvate kinase